jgi:hypothetical protein
VAVVVVA